MWHLSIYPPPTLHSLPIVSIPGIFPAPRAVTALFKCKCRSIKQTHPHPGGGLSLSSPPSLPSAKCRARLYLYWLLLQCNRASKDSLSRSLSLSFSFSHLSLCSLSLSHCYAIHSPCMAITKSFQLPFVGTDLKFSVEYRPQLDGRAFFQIFKLSATRPAFFKRKFGRAEFINAFPKTYVIPLSRSVVGLDKLL